MPTTNSLPIKVEGLLLIFVHLKWVDRGGGGGRMILLSGGYHIDFEDDPPLNSFANY